MDGFRCTLLCQNMHFPNVTVKHAETVTAVTDAAKRALLKEAYRSASSKAPQKLFKTCSGERETMHTTFGHTVFPIYNLFDVFCYFLIGFFMFLSFD